MSQSSSPSEKPLPDEDHEVFERLYEKHREAYDALADSDNPAAPIAQMVREEAQDSQTTNE